MRTWTIILYFAVAIVFLASIGVSLPWVFDFVNKEANIYKNLNQNIVTYFIAILVSASLDYVLKLIDDTVPYRKLAMLGVCVWNLGALVIVFFVLYGNSDTKIDEISRLSLIGVIMAYIMWWIANLKNPAFDTKASNSLGGDTQKPLTNG